MHFLGPKEHLAVKVYLKLNSRCRAYRIIVTRSTSKGNFIDCLFCRQELYNISRITAYELKKYIQDIVKEHCIPCAAAYLEKHKEVAFLIDPNPKIKHKDAQKINEKFTKRT